MRFTSAARLIRGGVLTAIRLGRQESAFPGPLHPSMWRRGFFSRRLYMYPGVTDRTLPYINDVRDHVYGRRLNSPSARVLVQDKDLFAAALARRGLAAHAPEVFGVITADGLCLRSPQAADGFRTAREVVIKPTAQSGGVGVRIVPPAEVETLVAGPEGGLIVQERVRQHRALAVINPLTLNTVRILAVRVAEDECLLAAAAHRWGTAASGPVDNVSKGGLVSSVDLRTGRLGPAVGEPRHGRRVEMDEHPDTGERITGVLVPQWAEVCDLAMRLMGAFPELDHVGWDLAVSDRGPLVIEGNGYMPGPQLFQFHGPFVHDPRLREYYVRNGLLPAT